MYFLRELPDSQTHLSLFYKYKRPEQRFGIATIDREQILFNTKPLHEQTKKFFYEAMKMESEKFDWGRLRHPAEHYIKCVYLAKDYLENNGFANPLGAHWDPRHSRYFIHPGQDRAKVLDILNAQQIRCIAFDSGNTKLEFEKLFDTQEQFERYFQNQKILFSVTADHGCLIPHVFVNWMSQDMKKLTAEQVPTHEHVPTRMIDTFNQLKVFWNLHRVEHNFDLFQTNAIQWSKGHSTIHMSAKNTRGILKGWVLSPIINKNYKDEDVEIKIED